MFFSSRKINKNEKDPPFLAENENETYFTMKYQEQHVLLQSAAL